jgi:threonine dehydratase
MDLVQLSNIKEASRRLKGISIVTPVRTSKYLNGKINADIYLKCENLQRTGSFKIRGAYNAVSLLPSNIRESGIIAHSSGNHAQALAKTAEMFNIPCTVVMPSNSSLVKMEAVRSYGADIVLCNPTQVDREETTNRLIADRGFTLVHPFDSDNIIAGAGTAALELVNEVGSLDFVFCPIGGGGLISGTSIVVKELIPEAKVIGVEPAMANDAYLSLKSGGLVGNVTSDTLADGLRTNLCERTFNIIKRNVDSIVLVSEAEIIEAVKFFSERMKLVVEPSGAVSLAGLIKGEVDVRDRKTGVIVSGGNVDLEAFFAKYGI